MNLKQGLSTLFVATALVASSFAATLEKGTPVMLAFDESFTSRHIKVGDRIRLHVVDDVRADGKVVIPRGEHVSATIDQVEKNGRFGKNGQLKISIHPLKYHGIEIPLQPRQKGNMIGGSRGTKAAGASAAGALVLGPVGLAAGYFVVGKVVTVHEGDKFETQVSDDIHLH